MVDQISPVIELKTDLAKKKTQPNRQEKYTESWVTMSAETKMELPHVSSSMFGISDQTHEEHDGLI